MRYRIQRTVMAVSFAMIVALGFPMLIFNISTTRAHVQELLNFEARSLAMHVEHEIDAGEPVLVKDVLDHVSGPVHIEVWVSGESTFQAGQGTEEDFLVADVTVGSTRVYMSQPSDVLNAAVANALVATLAVTVAAATIAWILAIYVSRRVQAPIEEFAMAAERMGTGDARPMVKRYGLPELDQVAEVLDRSAQRIQQLLDVERRLTSEVSHQLRSPLTALSLQIEEIREIADSPEEVREQADVAAKQIDRLTQVIEELVHLRRGGSVALRDIDLAQTIGAVVAESQRALQAEGRHLRVALGDDVRVLAAPGGVRNIIAILLENAAKHGAGEVTLSARKTLAWAIISVADCGPGLTPEAGKHFLSGDIENLSPTKRRSIGLPLAATLAQSQDGRLEWLPQEPALFRLYLRLVDEDEAPVHEEAEQRS
jgi:signal transduction histidine kinase